MRESATQKAENPHQLALMRVSILVVEYSTPDDTPSTVLRK
jgi:hypothetical protein